MAQTSSATREPSMEEILASIRRIIEDSDVTKQVSADLSAPQQKSVQAEARQEPRIETVKSVQSEADEKRGEVAHFPRSVAADAGNQLSSLTLEAVLRGTISDHAPSAEPTRAEIHEHNVSQIRITAVNPPVPPIVNASPNLPKLNATKASEALLMQVAEQRVVSLNPNLSPNLASPQTVKQEDAPVAISVSSKPTDKSLISQAAEDQVAASFGSLSQVLLEEQKRLMNEKMEAMLRPMLQEWLDTNLPPLVERLVREEIERVVRRG